MMIIICCHHLLLCCVLQQHQQQQILQLVHKVQLLLFKNLQEGKKEREEGLAPTIWCI